MHAHDPFGGGVGLSLEPIVAGPIGTLVWIRGRCAPNGSIGPQASHGPEPAQEHFR
jgi:hypothetical protein